MMRLKYIFKEDQKMKHTRTAAAAVALVMAMSNVPFTVNVSAEETAPKKTVEEMVNEVTSNNPKYDVKIAKLNIKGDTVELRNEEDGTLLVGKKIGYYDTFVKYNDDDTTSAETIFLPSAIKYMAVDVNGKALLDDYYIWLSLSLTTQPNYLKVPESATHCTIAARRFL